MRLGTALILSASLLLGVNVFAYPIPAPVDARPSLISTHSSSVSVVALVDKAQSRMDQVLAQIAESSVLGPMTLNNIISTTNDVTNTLATDLQILDPHLDTLMVDATGNELTDEALATKVSSLLKTFESACLTAKDTSSGEIVNILGLIALNIDDMRDGFYVVIPRLASIATLANEFRSTDASLVQLMNGILKLGS